MVIFLRDWVSTRKEGISREDNKIAKDILAEIMNKELKQNIQGQKLLEISHSSYDDVSVSHSICIGDYLEDNNYLSNNFQSILPLFLSSEKFVLKMYQDKILSGADLVCLALKWTEDTNFFLDSEEAIYYLACNVLERQRVLRENELANREIQKNMELAKNNIYIDEEGNVTIKGGTWTFTCNLNGDCYTRGDGVQFFLAKPLRNLTVDSLAKIKLG